VDNKSSITTIYDIARLVGVSGATVSRALNGKGYIARKTKSEIMRIAHELNYSPNPVARSLKIKRTNQIMLSMNNIRDYFNSDIIDAVQRVAKDKGYSLLINFTEDNEKDELRLLKNLRQNLVDGLIMISLNFNEKHLKEMANLPFPIVLSGICNNSIIGGEGQFDYVGVDSLRGIYMSTKHLIQQGHKKIGYVGLPSKVQIWDERFKGFCLAMEDSGLKIDEKIVITGGYDQDFGYEAGLGLAALDELPTAICASTDMVVLGLYRAFEEKGILIPNDICIVGMDNIDVTTLVKPKISSVAIAQADIGKTAAELIFKRLDGLNEPYRNIIFQPSLIVRESSVRPSK
jgi:LacI family transcriptional regulator